MPVLGLLAWAFIFDYRNDVPSQRDWLTGVDYIRSHRGQEDGLTWVPYWAEEGTPYFSKLNAFETPDLSQADFARFEYVWVLVSHGKDLSDLPKGLRATRKSDMGALQVWLVHNTAERIVYDLYDALPEVRVFSGLKQHCDFWAEEGWHCLSERRRKKTEACLQESTQSRLNRFRRRRDPHCGLSPWFHVSRDIRVIDRYPRRCIWMHPKREKPFRLDWSVGSEGNVLNLRYGFTDRVISMHSRPKPRTHPATIKLKVGKRAIEVVAKPVNGWFDARFDLPAAEAPRSLSLSVETENPVDAHLCLELSIRQGGAP